MTETIDIIVVHFSAYDAPGLTEVAEVMRKLGMRWVECSGSALFDSYTFHDCENVPDQLPFKGKARVSATDADLVRRARAARDARLALEKPHLGQDEVPIRRTHPWTLNDAFANAAARREPPPELTGLAALLAALEPILKAVRVNDRDTLSRAVPDHSVVWTARGSWGSYHNVTMGDLRALARAAQDLPVDSLDFGKDEFGSDVSWRMETPPAPGELEHVDLSDKGRAGWVLYVGALTRAVWPELTYRQRVAVWADAVEAENEEQQATWDQDCCDD